MPSHLRRQLEENGQEDVLRFWERLSSSDRAAFVEQMEGIDFHLVRRLVDEWVLREPPVESFSQIAPVPTIPVAGQGCPDARTAWDAGEEALRRGRVGLLLVAGGQGTRLGFDGPKGAYPIGPLTKKSLFAYHAEKVLNIQERYSCTLPWYIMVSDTNDLPTQEFFRANDFFGLCPGDVYFFRQRMVPCVDERGKFMLEAEGWLATNPNGHGGVIPAMVDNGMTADSQRRGVDTLSYFQVDNWAVKVADPLFIGYHVLRQAEMSSKIHRKTQPRESVGVHCLCDGEYRVVEYSELDIYPQLLETDSDGRPCYYAGNPAIHILDVSFIERMYRDYDRFPWHRAHKKIARLDESGRLVKPAKPNGYKFETFVFDALRFTKHPPVALEIARQGEYTPIKDYDGDNSVLSARSAMRAYWAEWLTAAGCQVPRDASGLPACEIEISPRFALTQAEFVEKSAGRTWSCQQDLVIGPDGS